MLPLASCCIALWVNVLSTYTNEPSGASEHKDPARLPRSKVPPMSHSVHSFIPG